jgi:L-lactate utilization protein LutC
MTKKLKKPRKSLENLLSEHASLILDTLKNNDSPPVKEPVQIPTAKPLHDARQTLDHAQMLNAFMINMRKIKAMNLEDDISQYALRLEDKIFELCELYNRFTNILGNYLNLILRVFSFLG